MPGAPDHDAVEVINGQGQGPWLLVCEHASNLIPSEFDGLGLDAAARQSRRQQAAPAHQLAVSQHLELALRALLHHRRGVGAGPGSGESTGSCGVGSTSASRPD